MAFRIIPPGGSQAAIPNQGYTPYQKPSFNPSTQEVVPSYSFQGQGVQTEQPTQGPSFLERLSSGVQNGVQRAGNFLFPQTTQAIQGVREGGIQSLFQQRQQPMSLPERGVGFALGLLPGGMPLQQTLQANTPIGGVSRELLGQEVSGRAAGSVLSKLGAPLQKFFGDFLPSQLVKTSLRETGEAGEKAAEKAILKTIPELASRGGEELSQGVVRRGLVGTRSSLQRKALREVSGEVAGSLENQVQDVVKKLPGKPQTTILDHLVNAVEELKGERIGQEGEIEKAATKILEDKKIVGANSWTDFRKIKNLLRIGNEGSEQSTQIANALKAKMSNNIMVDMADQSPELARLLNDESFFFRLAQTTGKMGTRSPIPTNIISAPQLIFRPETTTLLAQMLRRGTQGAGKGNAAGANISTRLLLNNFLQQPQTPELQPDTVPSL